MFSETEATREINKGGNFVDFIEYASKKYGPVLEEDFPYYEDETTGKHKSFSQEELGSLLDVTPCAYIGSYIHFPSITKNEKDNVMSKEELTEFRNKVKKHIMENGAISTSIIAIDCFKSEFYNPETFAAYFNYTGDGRFAEHGHLVAIIGWDDNFPKENFAKEINLNMMAHT